MQIGVQMYTIRKYTQNLEDLAMSLKKIAELGAKMVQLTAATTCPIDPQWFAAELEKNGLTCPATHTGVKDILDDTDKVIKAHKIFGAKYIGIPIGDIKTKPKLDEFVKNFMPVAQKIKDSGLYLMYHNHAFEFKKLDGGDGRLVIEYLLDAFPPELLGIILDVYWVKFARQDPCAWIDRLKGRLQCVHLKDISRFLRRMTEVGCGTIDFKAILSCAKNAGTEHAFIEQDLCYGKDPFECVKTSLANLASMGDF